jgi:hypothetical protein
MIVGQSRFERFRFSPLRYDNGPYDDNIWRM